MNRILAVIILLRNCRL